MVLDTHEICGCGRFGSISRLAIASLIACALGGCIIVDGAALYTFRWRAVDGAGAPLANTWVSISLARGSPVSNRILTDGDGQIIWPVELGVGGFALVGMPADIPPITYLRLEVELEGRIVSVELEPSGDQQPLTDEGREVKLGTVVFELE